MFNRGYLSFIAAGLMLAASTSLCRAQVSTQPSAEESARRETWRKAMVRTSLPKSGCFKVSYPSTEWQEVKCLAPSPYPNRPRQNSATGVTVNTVGDGFGDWSAQSSGLISTAEGSFNSVDVSGGSDTNVFMLQLNTQFFNNPPACNGVAGCQGWQQFLWSPDQCPGGSCVFIEYWLLNYGASCPTSQPWIQDGFDCWFNTYGAAVPIPTVAELTGITMTATAGAGGQDKVTWGTGGSLYAEGLDSVLSLANYWNTSEFNVFGDGGGSETVFNEPTTLVLRTTVDNGTMNPPACVNESFTAEKNNLDLANVTPGKGSGLVCCAYGGASPNIQFMETSAGHTGYCGGSALIGDPHITTADGTLYNFQGTGEFVSLRDSGGMEIQTRQAPVSTTFIGTDPYDGLTTCVSLNTAVAARVSGHRVTYEPNLSGVPDPSGLQLRIDGTLTALGPQGRDLGDGGRVFKSSSGGELEVDFPDGKTLYVTPEYWASQSEWYLNVNVSNLELMGGGGEASQGSLSAREISSRTGRGIAGPIAAGSWLPALPNGASMGAMPATLPGRYEALYKKFADAWRVTDRDSLFDYAPGTSTGTFTRRDWPLEKGPCVVPNEKPVEPVSEEVAQAACRRVFDPNMHADCVFDVRATGNLGFAKTDLTTQRVLADSTTTSLTDDSDPSQVGETVTFTAFVAPSSSLPHGHPGGSIQFTIDGSNVGAPVMLDYNGRAIWKTSELKAGKHYVAANYIPGVDSEFLPSASVEKLQIVKRCFCDSDRGH